MVLSTSACANSLESLGMIVLGLIEVSFVFPCALNTILANSPVLLAWSKLKGKIWTLLSGNSVIVPFTQYSAIEIVDILR